MNTKVKVEITCAEGGEMQWGITPGEHLIVSVGNTGIYYTNM